MFIVTESKIYIFNFITFDNIDTIETTKNQNGLVGISTNPDHNVIAFPGDEKGEVKVKIYHEDDQEPEIKSFAAHESQIVCISLNNMGNLLATASDKGTLIRIFNVIDGTKMKELRRGSENAMIYSISFDNNSKYVCCTSDRSTIHIFSLGNTQEENNESGEVKNQVSFLSKITKLFNKNSQTYFDSEWSFAKFRIKETKCISSFGKDNNLIIITANGKYYQAQFDTKNGGDCIKKNEQILYFDN